MIELSEILRVSLMGPDLALETFIIGGKVDVFSGLENLVQKPGWRAVMAAEFAAWLQIRCVNDGGC